MGLLIDVAAKKITALSVPKNLLRYQQPKQFPIISRLTLLVGQESLTWIHESSSVGARPSSAGPNDRDHLDEKHELFI